MAEWQYGIDKLRSIADQQLTDVLRERGADGWELVEVLPPDSASGLEYRLIFKSEKSTVAGKDL